MAKKMGGASLPDPNTLIQEQAKANRVNTYNPYSETLFSQGPNGQWEGRTSFTPETQNLFNRQLDITGNPNAYQDYQDQSFAQARRLLDPYYEQQNRNFEQTMANRGQPSGGEAYDTGYRNLMDTQNRAYENAAFNALKFGEQARMNDYTRLAQILSNATATQPAPIDVMSPYMANANLQQQQSNNLWNAAGQLGAAGIFAYA